ncbi:MAG TPA: hypothetical protein VMW47_03595 [Verrucomicrobiae bacterium]|nr:hypothetical protein [Verrucomicrobiae bacterium]
MIQRGTAPLPGQSRGRLALGALLLACLPAGSLPVLSAPTVAPAVAPAVRVDGTAWRGHGTLALISQGQLELLDNRGAAHPVAGSGTASHPVVCANGGWVAYLRQGAAPPGNVFALPPPSLWVVRADGADPMRIAGDVASFTWSPQGERLAFTTQAGDGSLYLVAAPRSHPQLIASGATAHLELGPAAWAPRANRLALGVLATGPTGIPRSAGLAIVTARAGSPLRVVYRERGAGIEDVGWWPSGAGVVFWLDLGFSQSIAADGLPLESLAVAGGAPRRLALTLVHPSWLTWSPDGRTLAIVAGGNRLLWDGKRIVLCRIPEASCRAVPQPAGVIAYQPAWTPDGRLSFVRARAAGPFGPDDFDVTVARLRAWDSSQRIWTAAADGATARALAATGAGSLRPTWTPTGLLYVHDDALFLLGTAGQLPVQVAGPLTTPQPGTRADFPNVYYGYQGWSQLFSWGG